MLYILILALMLPACGWLGSNCKPESAAIAAEHMARAKEECPLAWPAIEAGEICKPDQPCPQCPAIEAGDKAIDKACE